MFESTLEAQALHAGERRFGTLSAAALAHIAFAFTIVAVTALIVPPVRTPDAPSPVVVLVRQIPPGDLTPRPKLPPAPIRGTDAEKPATIVAPPRDATEIPPRTTPELPEVVPPNTAPAGADRDGEGTPGDRNGSLLGIPGGKGDDRAGGGDGDAPGPVGLTGEMIRPVVLVKVEPSYPQAARRAGLGGRVTLRAVIAEDGSVESVEVFGSTNPLFDGAAVEAVRKWRYSPALMNGRPIRVYFSVVVNFIVR
jgi:protein TonB